MLVPEVPHNTFDRYITDEHRHTGRFTVLVAAIPEQRTFRVVVFSPSFILGLVYRKEVYVVVVAVCFGDENFRQS